MAGGTGFIGSRLIPAFIRGGHEITLLVRPGEEKGFALSGVRIVEGDPAELGRWQEDLATHEAVVNLAGASIFQRWTKKARREIRQSRISSTRNIAEAVKGSSGRTAHLFNASGVGYYGFSGDASVDEKSPKGNTFLADLAKQWETEAMRATEGGARVVLCRLGIVLGRNGGAFTRIHPLVKLHLGSPWGKGTQWFSWIHEEDCVRILLFLFERTDLKGPVNFTSPFPVTNRELMGFMNEVVGKKPYVPSIPGPLIRLSFGEFSTVFLKGQRAVPGVLQKEGFSFRFPALKEALADLVNTQKQSPVHGRKRRFSSRNTFSL